jgi:glutamate dehydrogenase/leucine dehydrogenase
MEVKFTVSGPAIGGAKSGINFDPNDPRKRCIATLVQSGITIIEKLLWNWW